jgi:hypothetical protein
VGRKKKLSKPIFGYFKTQKKVLRAIKPEGGGGKAFMTWPLVEELFLRLPLIMIVKTIHRQNMDKTWKSHNIDKTWTRHKTKHNT